MTDAPTVQGHRGARGVVPENTVASFRSAIESGCEGVELDVRLTRDGHVIVWHDPTLQAEKCLFLDEDLTDARVDELTLAQLRTIDVGSKTLAMYPEQRPAPGERIVTLAELFQACSEATNLWWTVEVKVDPTDPREVATRDPLTDKVIEAIEGAGLQDRSYVHSFDWAVLERSRVVAPHVARSALAVVGHTFAPGSAWLGQVDYADHGGDLAAAAAQVGAVCVSPLHLNVTPEVVASAHEHGMTVLPWTVNEPADVERMLACGVDAIVTDYPDRVIDLLRG